MLGNRLVLLGPPGVGKGTQAKLIALRMNVPTISTGEMLRAAVDAKTELGIKANEFMSGGNLVPDDIIIGLIEKRLEERDVASGFLLDGFPRTVPQAEALTNLLKSKKKELTAVLAFTASEEAVVARIGGRLTCRNCNAVFHETNNPPKSPGTCDVCSSRLVVREDDQPEAVRRRLEVYEAKTAPLFDYYEKQGLLRMIDASGNVDAVYAKVEALLK